jgi:hypothetical protein
MARQCKNIEKFGVPNPTKEQRRALCKRNGDEIGSESESGSDHEKENGSPGQQVSTPFFLV